MTLQLDQSPDPTVSNQIELFPELIDEKWLNDGI
jgi:hypothetical protein